MIEREGGKGLRWGKKRKGKTSLGSKIVCDHVSDCGAVGLDNDPVDDHFIELRRDAA